MQSKEKSSMANKSANLLRALPRNVTACELRHQKLVRIPLMVHFFLRIHHRQDAGGLSLQRPPHSWSCNKLLA
eukprot:scaffold203865_cov19-Prasinocladus_malaysianus.AAC.1